MIRPRYSRAELQTLVVMYHELDLLGLCNEIYWLSRPYSKSSLKKMHPQLHKCVCGPLSDVPPFIYDPDRAVAAAAKWRLVLGK